MNYLIVIVVSAIRRSSVVKCIITRDLDLLFRECGVCVMECVLKTVVGLCSDDKFDEVEGHVSLTEGTACVQKTFLNRHSVNKLRTTVSKVKWWRGKDCIQIMQSFWEMLRIFFFILRKQEVSKGI